MCASSEYLTFGRRVGIIQAPTVERIVTEALNPKTLPAGTQGTLLKAFLFYFNGNELTAAESQWLNSYRPSTLVKMRRRCYWVDRTTAKMTIPALNRYAWGQNYGMLSLKQAVVEDGKR